MLHYRFLADAVEGILAYDRTTGAVRRLVLTRATPTDSYRRPQLCGATADRLLWASYEPSRYRGYALITLHLLDLGDLHDSVITQSDEQELACHLAGDALVWAFQNYDAAEPGVHLYRLSKGSTRVLDAAGLYPVTDGQRVVWAAQTTPPAYGHPGYPLRLVAYDIASRALTSPHGDPRPLSEEPVGFLDSGALVFTADGPQQQALYLLPPP